MNWGVGFLWLLVLVSMTPEPYRQAPKPRKALLMRHRTAPEVPTTVIQAYAAFKSLGWRLRV